MEFLKKISSSNLYINNPYLTKGSKLIIIKHFSCDFKKQEGIFLSRLVNIFYEEGGEE